MGLDRAPMEFWKLVFLVPPNAGYAEECDAFDFHKMFKSVDFMTWCSMLLKDVMEFQTFYFSHVWLVPPNPAALISYTPLSICSNFTSFIGSIIVVCNELILPRFTAPADQGHDQLLW